MLAAEGQILMLRGHIEESRARCERAIAIARRVGARAVEGHALNTLGVCMATTGDRAGAAQTMEASLAIAQELDESDDQCRVYVNLGDIIDQDGRALEAVDIRAGGRARRAAARRAGVLSVFLEGEASLRLVRLGRLDEAREVARRRAPHERRRAVDGHPAWDVAHPQRVLLREVGVTARACVTGSASSSASCTTLSNAFAL